MSLPKPSIGAAEFVTSSVAAVALCLYTVTVTSTAWAEEPDDRATSVPAQPASPTEPTTEQKTVPTSAMTPEAKAHYDRGLDLYGARDYPAAINELERGFKMDPRREFLFAEAQAFRLAGDCLRAVSLYRRFLESTPSQLQAEAAQLGIDRCGSDRSPAPAKPTVATPPPLASVVPPAPVTDHPIWWRDPWAALSIGAGVAALGVGVGFEIASGQAQDDARSMRNNNYAAFQRLWESAEQRRTIAVTATLGGVVLLAAGGARLILLHRRERASDPSNGAVSFLPVRGGGALCWQGAF